ncbi:MAG TPA: HEPN domain-containing protein [Ignavibacteria bacterium]
MRESDSAIVNTWIEKADHDLGSAKLIFQHLPSYFDTIAFHCQQAVEKYIKASLIYLEIEFQRSHDLPYLLEILSRKVEIKPEIFDKAILLNGFSVEIRYPLYACPSSLTTHNCLLPSC